MRRSKGNRKLLALLAVSALLTAWLPADSAMAEGLDAGELQVELSEIAATPEPLAPPELSTPTPESTPVAESTPAPETTAAPETSSTPEATPLPSTETTPVPEASPAPTATPTPEATVIDPSACVTLSGGIEWNGYVPVAVTFTFSGGGQSATCSSSAGYTFSVPKYVQDEDGSFTNSDKTAKYSLADYSDAAITAGSVTIASGTFSFTQSGKNFSASFKKSADTKVYTSADVYVPVLNDVTVTHKDMLPESLKTFYEAQDSAALKELEKLSGSAHTGGGVDLASVAKDSPQIKGWLELDGTELDCPVVQGLDNSYYLSHSAQGVINRCGTLFIDSGCDGLNGRNTVVYGRNMGNGSLFGELTEYQTQDFYDGHRAIDFYTADGSYKLTVFAAFTGGDQYGTVAPLDFESDGEFTAFIGRCAERSVIKTDVQVDTEDKLVSLVTGTNRDAAERFVVMCTISPAD